LTEYYYHLIIKKIFNLDVFLKNIILLLFVALMLTACGGGGGAMGSAPINNNGGNTGGDNTGGDNTGGDTTGDDADVGSGNSSTELSSNPLENNTIPDTGTTIVPVVFDNTLYKITTQEFVGSFSSDGVLDFVGVQSTGLGNNGIAILGTNAGSSIASAGSSNRFYEAYGTNSSYAIPDSIASRNRSTSYADNGTANTTLVLTGTSWSFVGSSNQASGSNIDNAEYFVFTNSDVSGLDYNNFGFWLEDVTGQSSYDTVISVFTVGDETAFGSIPTSGSATFNGSGVGLYITSANYAYQTYADATVVANFVNRTLDFSLSSTLVYDYGALLTGAGKSNPDLDITNFSLSYGGTNAITGSSCVGTLCGQVDASFYGPSATEIGGLFNFNAFHGSYLGSFGVTR